MSYKQKTETTRKGFGKIVKFINNGFNCEVNYYVLFDSNGNFIDKDIDYNRLHSKLYAM